MKINYQQIHFLKSASCLSQLPPDNGAEVAFVGRSNAGKSSALNTITCHKQLARTSKTPGRTQLINVFDLAQQDCRLVDLPGYGYAKVDRTTQNNWAKLLERYLCDRQCLRGLILLVDCRRLLKDTDENMLNWAHQYDVPLHVLLTKADKLPFGQAQKSLLAVQTQLTAYPHASVQLFSATKRTGLTAATDKLDTWFNAADNPDN